jgi:hypothetical protein
MSKGLRENLTKLFFRVNFFLLLSNCRSVSGTVFTPPHFLQSKPNKLECYITLSWKDLPRTNTLAYWIYSLLKKKKNVVNTASGIELLTPGQVVKFSTTMLSPLAYLYKDTQSFCKLHRFIIASISPLKRQSLQKECMFTSKRFYRIGSWIWMPVDLTWLGVITTSNFV